MVRTWLGIQRAKIRRPQESLLLDHKQNCNIAEHTFCCGVKLGISQCNALNRYPQISTTKMAVLSSLLHCHLLRVISSIAFDCWRPKLVEYDLSESLCPQWRFEYPSRGLANIGMYKSWDGPQLHFSECGRATKACYLHHFITAVGSFSKSFRQVMQIASLSSRAMFTNNYYYSGWLSASFGDSS